MFFFKNKTVVFLAIILVLALTLVGCSKPADEPNNEEPKQEAKKEEAKLSGEIKIDGSSTVFPITEAMAEEFTKLHPDVRIPVGISGTGGGFKKFVVKETAISDASRPIKDKEAAAAKENGVEYIELTVAYDGLSVLVNPANTWVDSLTVDELKKIWGPESTVKTWKDVRPEWPAEEIKLYAPGTDSGTFDYFTEEINGKSGAIRQDFTPSEDDNVLVQGIAGDKNALGFFGFAYYIENKDKLKAVKIDSGQGPVGPSFETIADGSYTPLSRPIFIYVNKAELKRPEVKEFVKFYMENAKELVPQVGYVALSDDKYAENLKKIEQ
jgi:phosphate transport system substrate-binding protein